MYSLSQRGTRLAAPILALMIAAAAQAAPGIEGHWQGVLEAGPMKLRLALHIGKAPDGSLTGTMDSLDQGANGLPLEKITVQGDALRFTVDLVGGVYEGKISPGGAEIAGTWKQGGASLPLTFRRTEKAPELKRPQEPSKPYPYNEEQVAFENKTAGVKLAGTLTLPRAGAPFPAVILINGSGPQDRNGTVAGHRIFLVLADRLTRRGFAVLRLDDRGVGESTGSLEEATTEDLTGDVLSGVAWLKNRKDINPRRIGLIGHSEGGLIAPLAAVRSPEVAFLVLMAAPGVTGEQIMYRQSELIARAMGAPGQAIAQNRRQQEQMFAIVRQEKDPKAIEARLEEAFHKVLDQLPPERRQQAEAAMESQLHMLQTPWFRFFLTYDPAPTLANVRQPVLVLAGERDLQVPPGQNLPAIEKALQAGGNKSFRVIRLPGLNHLFQTAQTGTPLEYSQIEETIAPAALDAISNWLSTITK